MKKLLLVLALSLALIRPVNAETFVELAAVTATGASTTLNTFGHKLIRAQVWSAAGSTATVLVESRSSADAPWFPVATISNPSATGEYWAIPRCYQVRLNVSAYTAGTISGNIERYDN